MVQRVGLHAPNVGGPGSIREPDPTCYIINRWGSANPTIREYIFARIRMAIVLLKRVMSIGEDVEKLEYS